MPVIHKNLLFFFFSMYEISDMVKNIYLLYALLIHKNMRIKVFVPQNIFYVYVCV